MELKKKTKITTPVEGFTGDGPGGLKFQDGIGYTSDESVIQYCRISGYGIGSGEPHSQPLDESEKAALREWLRLTAQHTGEDPAEFDDLEDADPVKVRQLLASPFDPRLLRDGGIIVVGSRLRDAAVDPMPSDFRVTAHSGEGKAQVHDCQRT
jgi:hypothetical protein